ncbi:MAG: hypothetical protein SXG53_03135 [Pseudomonadota bacterium]|nr:hypothetical protein [Pseudomonadota bacterium]
MRPTLLLLALAGLPILAATGEETGPPEAKLAQPSATPDRSLPFKAEHPGDTALSQDAQGNWRFRSFPALATLYVYDKDVPGKSNCGAPCVSAWVPLIASAKENEPIGDWTLISRSDGRHQWAYKGQPVYMRYHDLSAKSGNIRAAGFQKLEP